MTTAIFDYKDIRERMQTNPFGLKPDEQRCTSNYSGLSCPATCDQLSQTGKKCINFGGFTL